MAETRDKRGDDPDVTVVGGGLVGASLAYGLIRAGLRVTVLDEGDTALRASRGNFALIWVQSKGLAMPPYAIWTQRSAEQWHQLAAELREETSIDVAHSQPGGFTLCLSDQELDTRATRLTRFHNQPDVVGFPFEILDHAETKRRLPDIGKDVAGSVYSPLDGHVNSPRLLRALHTAFIQRDGDYRPNQAVDTIVPVADGFRIRGNWGELRTGKIVLAAGLGNARLAPMVGLEAPVNPSQGQIIVTEKTERFLDNPMVTIRQTDEGGVMIGDSQEDGFDTTISTGILSIMAERACKMFPRLAGLNVVRSWTALRVMTPDKFPVYDEAQPGAFIASCHSGVTLAAAHALTLGDAIATRGHLPDLLKPFTARRFHVQPGV
jgi:glycine/D-amino acid oxidase-like deaminating enzyme